MEVYRLELLPQSCLWMFLEQICVLSCAVHRVPAGVSSWMLPRVHSWRHSTVLSDALNILLSNFLVASLDSYS